MYYIGVSVSASKAQAAPVYLIENHYMEIHWCA